MSFHFVRNFILLTTACAASLPAASINWVDWTNNSGGIVTGTLLFGINPVTVTYTGQTAFVITGAGTNYWTEPNAAARPYTGGTVTNAPPPSDIIAMSTASTRSLSFSESVSDLYFAYVSLNGNGFVFDRDFEIISQGQGFWGNGSVVKQVVGSEYRLTGTGGEPHGLIRFTGSFNSITWSSNANENWYGFTLGAGGRTADAIPEPSTFVLGIPALIAGAILRKRRA
jgi:hypothetical protein